MKKILYQFALPKYFFYASCSKDFKMWDTCPKKHERVQYIELIVDLLLVFLCFILNACSWSWTIPSNLFLFNFIILIFYFTFSGGPPTKKRKTAAGPPQPKNPISTLNELRPGLEYVTVSQEGPSHSPNFTVSVEVS